LTALRRDRELFVGDQLPIRATVDGGLAAGFVRCTVKQFLDHGDDVAVAECDSLDGGIVVTGDTDFTATFSSEVTEDWPIGLLWYDAQLITATGEVCTLLRGAITTRRRITRTRTVAGTHTPLAAGAGALTLTAADADFARGLVLPADAGALTLAGADATLVKASVLAADAGGLTLTGADVTLTYAVSLDARARTPSRRQRPAASPRRWRAEVPTTSPT
jgi:hypothetical protein